MRPPAAGSGAGRLLCFFSRFSCSFPSVISAPASLVFLGVVRFGSRLPPTLIFGDAMRSYSDAISGAIVFAGGGGGSFFLFFSRDGKEIDAPDACSRLFVFCDSQRGGRCGRDRCGKALRAGGLKRLSGFDATGVQIYAADRRPPPKNPEAAPAASGISRRLGHVGRPPREGRTVKHYAARPGRPPTAARSPAKESSTPRHRGRCDRVVDSNRVGGCARPFDHVRAVQRLFTSGGSAPAGACTQVGQTPRGAVAGRIKCSGAVKRGPLNGR